MSLISGLSKAIKNTAKAVSSAVKNSQSGSSSGSSGSSGGSSKNKPSNYYDANKDYAASIKKATSTSEKNKLIAERQNKIDAMNNSGTNTAGYSNSVYSGGGNNGNSNVGALTPERAETIKKMYSGVQYDKNTDYAQAIKNAAARFGSEPYNVVQGEIDKLENQRYAKMLAEGTLNSSNMAAYKPVSVGNVNYGNYTPDYYEKIINDTASTTGAVGANNLFPSYTGTQQAGVTDSLYPNYNTSLDSYNTQMQDMLKSFQTQQDSVLNDLKQSTNYYKNASSDVSDSARNIYSYDNAYKGGQGANIKKSNAVSKYLSDSFKSGKFNQ